MEGVCDFNSVVGVVVADLEAEVDGAAQQVVGVEEAVEQEAAFVLEGAQLVEAGEQFLLAGRGVAAGLVDREGAHEGALVEVGEGAVDLLQAGHVLADQCDERGDGGGQRVDLGGGAWPGGAVVDEPLDREGEAADDLADLL